VECIELALANRREEGLVYSLDASPWLIPAEGDPTRLVPRSRSDNWMRSTKQARGLNIPRIGYHGEKRAGIQDPKLRKLDPAVQEELAGAGLRVRITSRHSERAHTLTRPLACGISAPSLPARAPC
jgi:hypothetical protein